MEMNLGVGVLAIKETNEEQFMGIVLTILISELLITIYEVGIRLFISEYVFRVQIDKRRDLFDVLIVQFHLVSVPFDSSSVFLEADRVEEDFLISPSESLFQGRQAVESLPVSSCSTNDSPALK